VAWAARGAAWRAGRAPEFAPAHWPLVAGAVGLMACLSTAENEMLAPVQGHDVNDKVLHFGSFAVITLLACYAFGPLPTGRFLKSRVALAVLAASAMSVLVEYGQRYLTHGRTYDLRDMFASIAGAALAGLWWWAVRRAQTAGPAESPPG
jgi:VanZ family protein